MKHKSETREVNLINIVETISKNSAKSQLKSEKLEGIREEISILSEFLNITPIQTVLFSSIVEMSLVNRTNIEALARHFKLSPLKAISFLDEIDVLVNSGLIRKCSRSRNVVNTYNDILFKVPDQVLEAIQKKESVQFSEKKKYDLPKFLEKVSQMADEVEYKLIATRQLIAQTETLIDSHRELNYVSYVDDRIANSMHKCIVFVLSYLHLIGQSEVELSEFSEDIFDDISDQFSFNQHMIRGNHELIKKELVTLRHAEFGGVRILSISDSCISHLFEENQNLKLQDINSKLLIHPDSLKERRLYFGKGKQQDIDNLVKTLTGRRFTQIRKQLEQKKLNSGISILLYGASGTGKTELVYQMAKKTGREIMMVDLSETKSMWFGESEKRVKKIFEDYRLVMQSSKKCPILFFNEADGLFSKRLSISSHSRSSQNVLNTMQNILLQALESFDGILLATTNLTENLDKAFDRRFLFKIRFTRPDADCRYNIWKNRLPELPVKQLRELSEKFELTGAQIENMVKQALLTRMVSTVDLYDSLEKNCRQELRYGTINKVGY